MLPTSHVPSLGIRSGLKGDEEIVVAGQQALRNGLSTQSTSEGK